MTPSDGPVGLAGLVGDAGPDLVRRPREGFADDAVSLPLRLLAALDLRGGRCVAVVADAAASRWTVPLVRSPDGVRRAVAGDGVAEALVGLLADRSGVLDPIPGADPGSGREPRIIVERWYAEPVTGEREVAVDQTNESLVVGGRAVVKWTLRQPAEGLDVRHPAADRLRALTGFDGTPRPWGALSVLLPGAAEPLLLATVATYLPHALDGWDWAVAGVRAYARGHLDLDAAVAPAAAIGDVVARMHVALAATGRDALAPDGAQEWARAARADLAEALRLVDGPEGERLSRRAAGIEAGLAPLADAAGTPLVQTHGDLHVGQVLRYDAPGGRPRYAVVDFDGNPVLAPAERARRRPAAVDVAGMLASLDHVGRVVLRRTEGIDTAAVERWIPLAENAFLAAYRSGLAAAGASDLLDERLLRPVRLQQECREFLYAVRHLPHWRYVPDGALRALLDEGGTR